MRHWLRCAECRATFVDTVGCCVVSPHFDVTVLVSHGGETGLTGFCWVGVCVREEH